MSFSRWLFLTIPAFAIAAILLGFTVRSLLRTLARSAVVSMPLEPSQTFRLAEGGPYDLFVEGSFASNDFVGLDYALADSAGRKVPMGAVVFRAHVRTLSRARLQIRSFDAPGPGDFTLRVTGVHPNSSPGDRILINRPVRSAMVLHILALLALGVVTIGSLVASGILVFGLDRGSR